MYLSVVVFSQFSVIVDECTAIGVYHQILYKLYIPMRGVYGLFTLIFIEAVFLVK